MNNNHPLVLIHVLLLMLKYIVYFWKQLRRITQRLHCYLRWSISWKKLVMAQEILLTLWYWWWFTKASNGFQFLSLQPNDCIRKITAEAFFNVEAKTLLTSGICSTWTIRKSSFAKLDTAKSATSECLLLLTTMST